MSNENMSIEETFAKLEETITQLEKEDISLEESLKAYEQGMEYKAEKKVLLIRENGE